MKWQIAAVAVLAGCAGQQRFSAPAPVSALDCAIHEAERIGYRRLASNRQMGVRLGKYLPLPPARERRPRTSAEGTSPDLGEAVLRGNEDGPLESQFRVWHRDGQLHFEVLSEREDPDAETRTTGDAAEDAQRILGQCSAG